MILSSADILRILGGSEIIRLSAKLSIADGKPPLSGAEGLFVHINRFPSVDEFEATWTIWIESDGSEPDDLVVAEIKKLLPAVKMTAGLLTVITTTDFRSESTQVAPEAPKPQTAQVDLQQYEERFQSLVEDVQDQMLLVSSGRPGRDGADGRDGVDGRDGKDIDATKTNLEELANVDQGIPKKKGQVLTWNGTEWTNLFVPQISSVGGGGGGGSGGVNTLAALLDTDTSGVQDGYILVYNSATGKWEAVENTGGGTGGSGDCTGIVDGGNVDDGTAIPPDCSSGGGSESGIPEAPQDGGFYVRQNGSWINLSAALTALGDTTTDGGNFSTGTSTGDGTVTDGGIFT